jgi:choline dehydrogenase-like flavoprotein
VSVSAGVPALPDEVDYLIVGSGPGGAVAAYRLACDLPPSARIAVLERGGRHGAQDHVEGELDMLARLYKEGGVQQTRRSDLIVLQAECLGGGSVINNAVCYRMPSAVRSRWKTEFDIDLGGLDPEYDRIQPELLIGPLGPLGINTEVRDAFVAGVNRYRAKHGPASLTAPSVVDVNAPGAAGDGLWNVGNKFLRKRTTLETYIPWAEARLHVHR